MMTPASFISMLALAAGSPPVGPFGMPEQASTIAAEIDFVYQVITWVCIFFFVLIVFLIVVFVIKYSKPPGTKAEGTATHNTPLEVAWTVLPLILVIGIFYVGMKGYVNMRNAPLGAYEIHVNAQKWNWQFNYPNGATISELKVPLGRDVKLIMSSQDVLHSLFIPSFRVKQDVVPGRLVTLWFNATHEGEYDLYCAEYCGTQHSTMLTTVFVLKEDEFARQIEEDRVFMDKLPPDRLYVAGPRLFARCKSCHSLDGSTMTGPTWKGLWEKTMSGETVFTDGTTLKDLIGEGKMFLSPEDYIYQSIANPLQKIVMNFTGAMPTFQGMLTDLEVVALTDFMKNLDKFDEQGVPIDPEDDLQRVLELAKEAEESSN